MADKKYIDQVSVKETLSLFWQASWRYKRHVWLTSLLPISQVLMGVGIPYYVSVVLAKIAHGGQNVRSALIMLALMSLAGVVLNRIGFLNGMTLQAKTMSDLQRRCFNHLMARSVGFHADRISGKLISDTIDLITAYTNLVSVGCLTAFGLALNILVGVVVVLSNSWQLGVLVMVIVASTLIWAGFESRKRAVLRNARLVASKNLVSHLSDNIVNVQTVKTFAREADEAHKNKLLNFTLRDLRIRDWGRAGRSGTNRVGVLLLMQFVMILYIVHLTQNNPGVLAAGIFAFTYTLTLTNRLFEINNITRQVEESFLQASPMVATLREPLEIADKPGATQLTVTRGELTMDDVSFSYKNLVNGGDVFSNFSLTVAPGERVGLVGPSGGGKSTLTRLLLRFDDIEGGTIAIDGQDITNVTQTSLREAIAYVPQEPLLFHRTIRDNIAYGRPDASEADIIAAAKRANAHDFITALAQGYGTVVGERGVKLSGGQRQRIAIARAILKDAPLLILDEATSALDSENEVQVQAALWELMKGRTAVVIAHRLSTIQKMDRIVVLDNGKITEEGSHKALLKKKGLYAKLWAHQSDGFLED